MSLSKTVTKAIDGVVHNFIQQISDKYKISPEELLYIWEGDNSSLKLKPKTSAPIIPDDADHSLLMKCTKLELVALCKEKGLRHTGKTKSVLVARLTGKEEPVKTTPKSKAKSKIKDVPVIKKLISNIPRVAIRRNQFGKFEHPETSLIFNNKTQKVIGKQNDDGTIDDLTPTDIDICNQYKFQYETPENLDKNSTLADVKVDDLEEEQIEEEEFEEEEFEGEEFEEEEEEEEFEEEEFEEEEEEEEEFFEND
jgi:hypothetical protein